MRFVTVEEIDFSHEKTAQKLLREILSEVNKEVNKLQRIIATNFLFKDETKFQPHLDSRNDTYHNLDSYEEEEIVVRIYKRKDIKD